MLSLSLVVPSKRLVGFAKICAWVLGFIYWELFFRPGPSSQVEYPLQALTAEHSEIVCASYLAIPGSNLSVGISKIFFS